MQPQTLRDRRGFLAAACMALSSAAWADPQAQRDAKSRAWFTDTILQDQDGTAHRLYSDLLAPDAQRVVVMHAVFTTCASACPVLIQRLNQVRLQLEPQFGRELWFLSLSVDPLSDTPQRLKAFAAKQGVDVPGWRFLTGKLDDVERVARRIGLWTDRPDDHQTTLIAGCAARAHWAKLRPDGSPQALAQQLMRLWT
jgi:protein SCO1